MHISQRSNLTPNKEDMEKYAEFMIRVAPTMVNVSVWNKTMMMTDENMRISSAMGYP